MSKGASNYTRLLGAVIARMAVPPGGGLMDAVEFIRNNEKRKEILAESKKWLDEAIQAVKNAPDNTFVSDEEISDEILRRLEEKKKNEGPD